MAKMMSACSMPGTEKGVASGFATSVGRMSIKTSFQVVRVARAVVSKIQKGLNER